jgi:hypothetical protein
MAPGFAFVDYEAGALELAELYPEQAGRIRALLA